MCPQCSTQLRQSTFTTVQIQHWTPMGTQGSFLVDLLLDEKTQVLFQHPILAPEPHLQNSHLVLDPQSFAPLLEPTVIAQWLAGGTRAQPRVVTCTLQSLCESCQAPYQLLQKQAQLLRVASYQVLATQGGASASNRRVPAHGLILSDEELSQLHQCSVCTGAVCIWDAHTEPRLLHMKRCVTIECPRFSLLCLLCQKTQNDQKLLLPQCAICVFEHKKKKTKKSRSSVVPQRSRPRVSKNTPLLQLQQADSVAPKKRNKRKLQPPKQYPLINKSFNLR
jgi:hypothetical protein